MRLAIILAALAAALLSGAHNVACQPGREPALGMVRPRGCPRAWCGCWLMHHLGLTDQRLYLARRWAAVGDNAGGPGAGVIAVWPHHVGLIVAAIAPGRILVLSGNDSRAVRQRARSTRGIIAYRKLRGI